MTKSGALMSQRPDLRRTRQLLRQNIIATKARIAEENGEYEHPQENEEAYQQDAGYEYAEEAPQEYRPNPTRSGRIIPSRVTPSQELIDEQEEGEEYAYEDVDPDLGYDVAYEDEIVHWSGFPKIGTIPFTGNPGKKFIKGQAVLIRDALKKIV